MSAPKPVTADSIVRYRRRDDDLAAASCTCCEGPHVYGYGLEGVDVMYWLRDAVRTFPDGQRVRITVEPLP